MNNSEFVTLIVKVVFAVVSVALTSYVLPYLSAVTEQYKDTRLKEFVYDSIQAAEQVIKGDKKGPEKKEKVLKEATEWLKTHHIDMSEEELDNLIESFVYNMKEQSK